MPPRAADLGDVGKYREELEKSRVRVKELEDEVRRAKERVKHQQVIHGAMFAEIKPDERGE